MTTERRESPIKRTNPSGRVVWYARYTDSRGRRRSAGTFKLKREAQEAIDDAYGRVDSSYTVGAYLTTWLSRHPRSERTNATNQHRVGRVLAVELEGRELRDWPLAELRRRHALELIDHMLRVQRRATTGAVGILRSLSAMTEDAINDEVAEMNPFRGLRVSANDPRAKKRPREVRVFSFAQMHSFAAAAGRDWEAMIRTFSDTGMRLGEVLPLERGDLLEGVFRVRRTAHEGTILRGTKDGPRRARRWPRGAVSTWPRAAHQADGAKNRHPAVVPDVDGQAVARAQLLPGCLEARPGRIGPRHQAT